MADDIYMNKNGFKCARSQLVKTDGRDPQEYEHAKRISMTDGEHDKAKLKDEVKKLRIRAPEYAEDA